MPPSLPSLLFADDGEEGFGAARQRTPVRFVHPRSAGPSNPCLRPARCRRRGSCSASGRVEQQRNLELRGQATTAVQVGIVGFGNFGQFIAAGVQRQGHAVMAASRSDCSAYCAQHGIRFFRSVDVLCEEQPDVLLICSSILSTESVVRAIPFHKFRPNTIVTDVLSVEQFPRNLLLEVLPPGFGIVCTHPVLGPESGTKHGWGTLPFIYDKVRVAEDGDQVAKCDQFLSIFEQEGCRMVEMS